ncbi:IS630 family transposase [Streptomyces violaceusniger]|uniref:IS630 family transposase n=1 Tax=Streptomyces violaceusniger TaxID=68280 RepID=A0A4D4KUX6_STRVO|nr:IS630 family transposase [Streptomyces violaceusniger]
MLCEWARRRKTAQALAVRSRIILTWAQGGTVTALATELGVSRDMVSKWRRRFLEHRLEGLVDEPRPGRPRTVGDDQVEQVVVKTLESVSPKGDTHWSTRSMAKATGMWQTTVSRIWRAFGLKPHGVGTWKLSADPQFIDKVRDIVGLYLDPPERALVLCVDEKSQMQAIDRTAPILPVLPTTPARMSHDYVRHGTTSLFAALELSSGAVIAEHHRRHRHQEFLKFLKTIDKADPQDLDLHLVCDNYATHKTPAVHKWLLRHPRFHLHFTPTSASWLNLVERWFAELTNRKLSRSAHRSLAALEKDVRAWIPDAVFTIPGDHPLASTWRGTREISEQFMAPMATRFAPGAACVVEVKETIAEGDRVVILCTSCSTTAAGEPYAIDARVVFTVRDGKVAGMREFSDTQYFTRMPFPESS